MRHMIYIKFFGNNLYKVTDYFGTLVITHHQFSIYRSGSDRRVNFTRNECSFKRLDIDMSTP